MPGDLELDKALTRELFLEPGTNPHETLPCGRCHTDVQVPYEIAKKFNLPAPLKTEGDSSILLCEECHGDRYHSFHPVNFDVKELGDKIDETGIFPLETIVEGIDKLTCTTCHDLHFPHNRIQLLRGYPVAPRPSGKEFSTRVEFCEACHDSEEVKAFSGHWEAKADKKCNLCHLGFRKPGVPGPLKRQINQSCGICHPIPRGKRPHFYRYNPFPDFTKSELEGYGLSLDRGRYTCTTCHTHHRSNESKGFLRAAFITVISKSLRVNPHQTTRFCQNCHPFDPQPPGTPDAVAPLWEEDVTRLCRGCHSKKDALKMDHPLGMPSGMNIPDGWALRKDGSLGCQTCHLAGHGPFDPDNPHMLRGGEQVERNDICFNCHNREEYVGRDIHLEVAEFTGCEFCHIVKERTALRPEGKVGDLLAEPTLLCLLCHNPLPHPASSDHTVLLKQHSFVSLDPDLTPLTMGKITCHSCHDAHSTDVEERYLRRTRLGAIMCSSCHPL